MEWHLRATSSRLPEEQTVPAVAWVAEVRYDYDGRSAAAGHHHPHVAAAAAACCRHYCSQNAAEGEAVVMLAVLAEEAQ